MLDYPIDTPENVRFHHTLAGPGTRLLAWSLDMAVVVLVLSCASMGFGIAQAVVGDYATAAGLVLSFLWLTGYWIGLELLWRGQTVGKRAFGLRVVGERGLRLTFGQVVLRNLLRLVDLLPGPTGIGATFMVLGREHRRLGDLVAGTLVIRERRVPAPQKLKSLMGSKRPQIDLPTDLTRRIPPAERELLLDLCMRRDALDDGVRLELFGEIAAHYRRALELHQGAGLSDEKLVLVITATLYQRLGGPA